MLLGVGVANSMPRVLGLCTFYQTKAKDHRHKSLYIEPRLLLAAGKRMAVVGLVLHNVIGGQICRLGQRSLLLPSRIKPAAAPVEQSQEAQGTGQGTPILP